MLFTSKDFLGIIFYYDLCLAFVLCICAVNLISEILLALSGSLGWADRQSLFAGTENSCNVYANGSNPWKIHKESVSALSKLSLFFITAVLKMVPMF